MFMHGFTSVQPLRGEGDDIYGYRHLQHEDKSKVRQHTALALIALEACALAADMNIPFILENPAMRKTGPSIFKLREYMKFLTRPSVQLVYMDQRMTGAPTKKPTHLLTNVDTVAFRCTRQARWWVVPRCSEWSWGPPILAGRQLGTPAESGTRQCTQELDMGSIRDQASSYIY